MTFGPEDDWRVVEGSLMDVNVMCLRAKDQPKDSKKMGNNKPPAPDGPLMRTMCGLIRPGDLVYNLTTPTCPRCKAELRYWERPGDPIYGWVP